MHTWGLFAMEDIAANEMVILLHNNLIIATISVKAIAMV